MRQQLKLWWGAQSTSTGAGSLAYSLSQFSFLTLLRLDLCESLHKSTWISALLSGTNADLFVKVKGLISAMMQNYICMHLTLLIQLYFRWSCGTVVLCDSVSHLSSACAKLAFQHSARFWPIKMVIFNLNSKIDKIELWSLKLKAKNVIDTGMYQQVSLGKKSDFA